MFAEKEAADFRRKLENLSDVAVREVAAQAMGDLAALGHGIECADILGAAVTTAAPITMYHLGGKYTPGLDIFRSPERALEAVNAVLQEQMKDEGFSRPLFRLIESRTPDGSIWRWMIVSTGDETWQDVSYELYPVKVEI